jgi:hypothetical protein
MRKALFKLATAIAFYLAFYFVVYRFRIEATSLVFSIGYLTAALSELVLDEVKK